MPTDVMPSRQWSDSDKQFFMQRSKVVARETAAVETSILRSKLEKDMVKGMLDADDVRLIQEWSCNPDAHAQEIQRLMLNIDNMLQKRIDANPSDYDGNLDHLKHLVGLRITSQKVESQRKRDNASVLKSEADALNSLIRSSAKRLAESAGVRAPEINLKPRKDLLGVSAFVDSDDDKHDSTANFDISSVNAETSLSSNSTLSPATVVDESLPSNAPKSL
jgi:hypothetical protein